MTPRWLSTKAVRGLAEIDVETRRGPWARDEAGASARRAIERMVDAFVGEVRAPDPVLDVIERMRNAGDSRELPVPGTERKGPRLDLADAVCRIAAPSTTRNAS